MRVPTTMHLLTTKIVFSIRSVTRHALELLACLILSIFRNVRPVVRHLRHVVASADLDGVRAITRYLRVVQLERIFSIVDTRLARNHRSQRTLILLRDVRLSKLLLLLLLLIVILNVTTQENIIIINGMIQLLLLIALVVLLIPYLIHIVDHVSAWIIKWLVRVYLRVHYVIKRISWLFGWATLHLRTETIVRADRAFLHLHLLVLLLLLRGVARVRHLRVLLRGSTAIHVVVHVIWDTGHQVLIVPATRLHISNRVLHILLLRAHQATNVTRYLSRIGALPLVRGARTSTIHHSSFAHRPIPYCLRLWRLVLRRLLDLLLLLIARRGKLLLHRAPSCLSDQARTTDGTLLLWTLKIDDLHGKTMLRARLCHMLRRKLRILVGAVVWVRVVAAEEVLVVVYVVQVVAGIV